MMNSFIMYSNPHSNFYIAPPPPAHFETNNQLNSESRTQRITIEERNPSTTITINPLIENECKLIFPKVYLSWDHMLDDAHQLVLRCEVDETKAFRATAINTFLVQMICPLLVLAIYLLFQIYYPNFSIWFCWVGFLLAIFVVYRLKELLQLLHFLKEPHQFLPDLPMYSETTEISNTLRNPPPAYNIATNLPPAYDSRPTN